MAKLESVRQSHHHISNDQSLLTAFDKSQRHSKEDSILIGSIQAPQSTRNQRLTHLSQPQVPKHTPNSYFPFSVTDPTAIATDRKSNKALSKTSSVKQVVDKKLPKETVEDDYQTKTQSKSP
jgi:hypothetical protein